MPLKRIKCSPLKTLKSAPVFPNKGSKALELPWELFLEILSYFDPPIAVLIHTDDMPGPSRYIEKADVLRALSQTCKWWRTLFLPLLWERFEPSLSPLRSAAWYKVYGDALIRKSSLVCENPEIASHVRIMSVSLSRYSIATVLPAFVRAIKALPNLQTLEILRMHHKMTTALKEVFDHHIFPQVRTITLPKHAHNIFTCFPEVRKVVCINGGDSGTLVNAIAKGCKKVEEIEGFYGSGSVMKKLVKAAPNLRSIKFDHPIPSKLAHITLFSNQPIEERAMADNELLACLKLAKDIVRNAHGQTHSRDVTIGYYNRSRYYSEFSDWTRALNVDII